MKARLHGHRPFHEKKEKREKKTSRQALFFSPWRIHDANAQENERKALETNLKKMAARSKFREVFWKSHLSWAQVKLKEEDPFLGLKD